MKNKFDVLRYSIETTKVWNFSYEKKEFVYVRNRTKHAFDVVESHSEGTIALIDSEERIP